MIKLEVAIGGMAIVIVGLVFMLAVLTMTLEARVPTAKMFPLVVPEIWHAAYGQGQQQQQGQGQASDLKIVEGSDIKSSVSIDLTFSELKDYRLYEDGRAEYIFESTNPGSNRTITILTNHGYTSAQGYIYNSIGVYTPGGSQRLIISTQD